MNNAVKTAIAESLREDRTVDLVASADSAEWIALAEALDAVSDGYSDENPDEIGTRRRYWGSLRGGNWQIDLIGTWTTKSGGIEQ